MAVKFYKSENQVPLEMHKVRMIQKLSLLPVEDRLKKIQEAGNNTFLLQNKDIYMDMLTDSGVNGMSDLQFGAMMQADDAYAGSETFNRVKAAVKEVFGTENVAQVRKSVDSPPGMLTEDHHHTVHEERQVCYSSHLRPKSLHL